MKTLDEVIKADECCDHGEPDSRCEDCPYNSIGACCAERESDALYYLKEYHDDRENFSEAISNCGKALNKYIMDIHALAQQKENLPLTWSELCTMEGKPVWVEQHHGDIKGWLLILRKCDDIVTCTTKHGNSFYLYKANYGEKWQAYRKDRG